MMKQNLRLIFLTLLCAVFSTAWGETATLTNANIVAAGDAINGYQSWYITDGNSIIWNAYAIKNKHSNATSSYHFLQIKKSDDNTQYYIQVPVCGTKITSITMTVSSTNQPMTGGSNSATLFFSNSNLTSTTGDGVASGTGASTVTIDCSSLNLNTGYITAGGAVRIWDVVVTYENQAVNQVATPVISPADVTTFYGSQEVTISTTTPDATIYYTTDNSNPTTSTTKTQYTAPFTINANTTVQAYAEKSNMQNSAVASVTYTKDTPSIAVNPASVDLASGESEGTISVTYLGIATTGRSVVFCGSDGTELTDDPDWIQAEIDSEGNIYYVASANQGETSRTVYLKVKGTGLNNTGNFSSAPITITQAIEPYAELPFEFTGGSNAISGTTGLTQEGLGDYNSAPKLKFDNTGDNLILHFNERPGVLKFYIKGNGFSSGSTSTFKVQTSADGTTYNDLATYTALESTSELKEFNDLGESVRYIKWVYTEKGADNGGNVALGNITLGEYGAHETYTLTITTNPNADIFAFDAEDQTVQIQGGSRVAEGTVILLSVAPHQGYQVNSVNVVNLNNNTQVSLTEGSESGTYTFTMPNSPVTVSCNVSELGTGKIYEKVTTLRNGTYLIVYGEGNLAFNGSLTTLDAVGNSIPVTINNNRISGTTTIDAATFTYDKKTGTLKSASGYYIGRTSDENGLNSNTSTWYENTITFDEDGNANISSGGATLRYNTTSGQTRFRYFKSSSSVQTTVQLYRLVDPESIDDVTISSVGYASLYYSSVNLIVPTGVTAYTYKLDADNIPAISRTYRAGSVIPEGEGVILKGNVGTYQFSVSTTVPESDSDNKLKGSDIEVTTTGPGGETSGYLFYVLSTEGGSNPGFYYGENDGVAFTCAAHKVYLPVPDTGEHVSSFTFDDMNGINETIATTTTNEGVYTISGVKVDGNKLQKGLYIINGKKVIIK